MNLANLVGQRLDGKYKIEKELGRGGMGAVYLATHIGTERPVALKIIVPQFMQRTEFVERFRREARAAGRLRHPNVVDVTDFGFAETSGGRVAYLVMEYLDGCTLGEVLEEEKKLPLSWTLDILEQVCSAVEEAHRRGIIHRDLKPDNIWLEPNQRGGYTVKVLDFGIAKLEATTPLEILQDRNDSESLNPNQTSVTEQNSTVSNAPQTQIISENKGATPIAENQTAAENNNPKTFASEAGTLIQREIDSESGTAILPPGQPPTFKQDAAATKLMSAKIETAKSLPSPTAELTHVGAVLGTPLYMSPEQCAGLRLDARSDIYCLAVMAYQMLSGKTPFGGDYLEVMRAHKETAPPALEAKKISKKVKQVVMRALAKNSAERPPTAQAFAAKLRAQSEGIGTLLQRALVIYTQNLPKFLLLAVLLYSPIAIITILQVVVGFLGVSETLDKTAQTTFLGVLAAASVFFPIFCGHLFFGTSTWLVAQILAFPLRPVALRPALQATRKKWKSLTGTGFLSTALIFLGVFACFVGFPILHVLFALVSPVVMMENLRGRAALKRSTALVRRSLLTTAGTIFIMFIVPVMFSGLIAFFVNTTVKSFNSDDEKMAVMRQETVKPVENPAADDGQNVVVKTDDDQQININIGTNKTVSISEKNESKDFGERLRATVRDALTQILLLPFTMLVGSFSSIVVALLYLKTRQAGGESMQDLLAQFGDAEQPSSKWQKRVRQRLEQSGKLTSKS